MTPEDSLVIEQAIDLLGEHFDSVRIFVTRYDSAEGGTKCRTEGSGNWYAQYGQISEWITKSKEQSREEMRKPDGD